MAKRTLSNEEIINLYSEQKLPLREVGERAGLSYERVRKILKRAGVPPRAAPGAPFKPITREQLEELYVREGLSIEKVAAALGVCDPTARRALQRHGFESRNLGHYNIKYPEFRRLAVGESLDFPVGHMREGSKGKFVKFYKIAKAAGIRVSVRSIDAETVRVTRIPAEAPLVKHRKLPKEEIARMYGDEKIPLDEIAERAGISVRYVHTIGTAAGHPRKSHYRDGDNVRRLDKEVLTELYQRRGLSLEEIAREVEASDKTVRRELRRLRIPPRGQKSNVAYPQLREMEIGEAIQLPAFRPGNTRLTSFHSMARSVGIKVSVRRIDGDTVRVFRKA